jgi:hypothetical protein
MELFYWYNLLILLGMLLSIPYFFIGEIQKRKKHLVIFLILLITIIVELLGRYLRLSESNNNTLVYNIGYVTIGLSLKIYFFFLVFHEKKEKNLVLLLLTAFITWCFINFLIIQTFGVFHHYSLTFGSLIIIGLCFNYFYGIFFKNWYLEKNLLAIQDFWIISFFMFFYSASLLYFISFSFFTENIKIEFLLQLNFLIKVLGVMMYMVMGLAFYAPFFFKKFEIN